MNIKDKRCPIAILTLAVFFSQASYAQHYIPIDVPGASATRAFGINNEGVIVGRYDDANGVAQGFLRRPNGKITRISVPAGVNGTWAQDINDLGVVVGRYFDADFLSHGFMLKQGRYITIDYPGAIETTVRGIDNQGTLSGNYIDAVGFETGFVKDRNDFRAVLYPGSDSTDVWDIAKLMVGDWSDIDGNIFGYSLRGNLFTNINVPDATATSIRGINYQGTMAGVFDDADFTSHGFARTRGGSFVQLDAPHSQFTFANRINEYDAIVGFYLGDDDVIHGYVVYGWRTAECR
jgi:hypothetical protein